MAEIPFEAVFEVATGRPPYPYQVALATSSRLPRLLNAPTGAGKTAAVILAWLYRRRFSRDEVRLSTPRRLIYCLPMRVLVEQTRDNATRWLDTLSDRYPLLRDRPVTVHTLMGGHTDDDWCLTPEEDSVIIGTQDMLLSRALNRGYAMSRFRWPQAFGLLNSDVLWVFDEIQLMGVGLATSAQLQAFRERLGVYGRAQSIWMSATAQPEWLRTVDHSPPSEDSIFRLDLGQCAGSPDLLRRMTAAKTLHEMPRSTRSYLKPKDIAIQVLKRHAPGSMSLVILNTVSRAQEVYMHLQKQLSGRDSKRKATPTGDATPEVLLLHSRFRPAERAALVARALEPPTGPGKILVSTQVVEAGVDISARLLITEIAPWPSLVQRFGRCNRAGEFEEASIFWADLPPKQAPPYSPGDLNASREKLSSLEGACVSPASLPEVDLAYSADHVVRLRDLIGLFDTTPDITGNDVDPSRFIRDAEDHDVHVFWRDIPKGETPTPDQPAPVREELCSVPLASLKSFLSRPEARVWRWDHIDERWAPASAARTRPGQVLMISSDSGGYLADLGWKEDSSELVPPAMVQRTAPPEDSVGRDETSRAGWQSLTDHSDAVVQEAEGLLRALCDHVVPRADAESVVIAARFHDWGKAHPVFRETMSRASNSLAPDSPPSEGVIWAKCPARLRHSRRYFRHELAAALALLSNPELVTRLMRCEPNPLTIDLVSYLVASHHGKVRMAIRSMPGEAAPDDGRRYALGVWEGDELPECNLGGQVSCPRVALKLAPMEIGLSEDGQPSWLERVMALRDAPQFGPFRLAYLEALLRAADARASAKAASTNGDGCEEVMEDV